jgi:hypothetical protein
MPLITTTSSAAAKGLGFTSQTSGARTSPIGGYDLWLDAADPSVFTYSSGTVVSRWTDKSTNGYFFEPTNSTQAPSRSGTQNSKSTLVFDGVNDGLAALGSTSNWTYLHNGTQCTVFVVYKWTKTAGSSDDGTLLNTTKYIYADIFAGYPGFDLYNSVFSSGGTNYISQYPSVNTGVILSGQTYPSRVTATNFLQGSTYNSWDISSGLSDVNNATTSNKYNQYNTNDPFPNSPGTGLTSQGWSGPSSSTPTGTLSIGRIDNSGGYRPFPGEIAEIIIYKSLLSSTDRTSMINYFKNKWNIT